MKTRAFLAATAAACGVAILFAQQRPAGPYTPEQATAGARFFTFNYMTNKQCNSGRLNWTFMPGGSAPAHAATIL